MRLNCLESTYKELKLGTAQVFGRVAKRLESTS